VDSRCAKVHPAASLNSFSAVTLLLLLLPLLLLPLLLLCSVYGDKSCLSPQLLASFKPAGRTLLTCGVL
jgi:hypothetical protein